MGSVEEKEAIGFEGFRIDVAIQVDRSPGWYQDFDDGRSL
jgi:hypothetical protein